MDLPEQLLKHVSVLFHVVALEVYVYIAREVGVIDASNKFSFTYFS